MLALWVACVSRTVISENKYLFEGLLSMWQDIREIKILDKVYALVKVLQLLVWYLEWWRQKSEVGWKEAADLKTGGDNMKLETYETNCRWQRGAVSCFPFVSPHSTLVARPARNLQKNVRRWMQGEESDLPPLAFPKSNSAWGNLSPSSQEMSGERHEWFLPRINGIQEDRV